jgi:acetyl-CoA decarbonylase/synthase complex subunit gamma
MRLAVLMKTHRCFLPNFSLTYFIVSGEIEGSRVPSYLLVKDTEGLSVMTAWAAGKFSADVIAPFVKKCGIADKVKHHKLIIPGYAAAESGGLEEELPDWEILVGPREGAHIPAYIKTWKP